MHTRKTQTINAVTSHMTSHRQHELMLAWPMQTKTMAPADKQVVSHWHQFTAVTVTKVCIIHRYDHGEVQTTGFRIGLFLMNRTFMFKPKLEIIITMITFTLKLNISSSNAATLCLNTFICAQYECRHSWIANPLWFPTFKYFQRSRINCTHQK